MIWKSRKTLIKSSSFHFMNFYQNSMYFFLLFCPKFNHFHFFFKKKNNKKINFFRYHLNILKRNHMNIRKPCRISQPINIPQLYLNLIKFQISEPPTRNFPLFSWFIFSSSQNIQKVHFWKEAKRKLKTAKFLCSFSL